MQEGLKDGHYTGYISNNPAWEFAGVYADEGISGTGTKKREQFKAMIADCRAGKIDMVITKSISRFARNTVDCLKYIRELKELGIPVLFEKEFMRIGRNPLFSRVPAFFYTLLSLKSA